MFLFFFAQHGLGGIISGCILPRIVKKLSEKSYIMLFYTLLFLSSMLSLLLFEKIEFLAISVLFSIYAIIVSISFMAIRLASRNILLNEIPQQDYAMAISIYNIPRFFIHSSLQCIFNQISIWCSFIRGIIYNSRDYCWDLFAHSFYFF